MTDKKNDVAVKAVDVLDELKKIEKIRKARLLSTALTELKTKAKQILILKRETTALLKEIGLCESDRKKVIDYVNSTIKLTPSDIAKAKTSSRKVKEDIDKQVEKKINEMPVLPSNTVGYMSTIAGQNWTNAGGYTTTGGTTGENFIYTASNTSGDLNVMLGDMKLKM